MKILCLTDFKVPLHQRWIRDAVPGNQDEIDFLHTFSTDRFGGWGKLFSSYPAYLRLALRADRQCRKKKYDLIVAWENDTGFPLALLRRLHGRRRPPLAILTFSLRGPLARFPWLMKFGAAGADFFTVTSSHEADTYAAALALPPERIQFCPYGVYDSAQSEFCKPENDFIFSGGRSGRDYRTFLAAVKDLPCNVVLNARPFNLAELTIPANVHVNDILPYQEFNRLNAQARFVVVPLQDLPEAVGISSVLFAMMNRKAVIASRVPGILDYVEEGKTGLLVEPGNPQALREAILRLWQDPAEALIMGSLGRLAYTHHYTFDAFARRLVACLQRWVA